MYTSSFETGFYYLQSRYYDPELGRFINADSEFKYTLLEGLNLFAYCGNNPVMRFDPYGQSPWYLNGQYYTYGDSLEDQYREKNNLPPVSYLKACNAQFVHCSPSYYSNSFDFPGQISIGGVGISGSVGIALDAGVSVFVVADEHDNSAITVTFGIGAGFGKPSASSGILTSKEAEYVWDLSEYGLALGATLGYLGFECDIGVESGEETISNVITISKKPSAEYHILMTYTWVFMIRGDKP